MAAFRVTESLALTRFVSVLVGLAVLVCAEAIQFLERQSHRAQVQAEVSQRAGAMRARLEGALNGVLYLDSGLVSYLTVHQAAINAQEITDMMSILHNQNPHIRNMAVAVGYRITYMYPVAGNERALGLDYRSIPEQYEQVKKVIDTRSSVLTGPVKTVQGVEAVIHRTAIFVHDKFWGLVSTLVDTQPLYEAIGLAVNADGYAYALRGRNGMGEAGDVFFGDAALFTDPGAVHMPITVPGGKWVLAVKPPTGSGSALGSLERAGGWAFSLLLGYLAYVLLRHRSEMSRLALHDGLTALPNRLLLHDRIDQAILRAQRLKQDFSIVFVDLDRFKAINDTFGHKAGDAVLKVVAERLTGALRHTDTIARWGGDEILLVLSETGIDEARRLTQMALVHIEKPVEFGPHVLRIGASFGIASYPADGTTMDELLKVADARMYSDKFSRNKRLQPVTSEI